MADNSMALSEPGSGIPVYPAPGKDILNGWRRDTPGGVNDASQNPPQIGADLDRINAVLSGVELS